MSCRVGAGIAGLCCAGLGTDAGNMSFLKTNTLIEFELIIPVSLMIKFNHIFGCKQFGFMGNFAHDKD